MIHDLFANMTARIVNRGITVLSTLFPMRYALYVMHRS